MRVWFIAILALALGGCASTRTTKEVAHLRRVPRAPEKAAPAVHHKRAIAQIIDGYGLPSSTSWVCEVEGSQKIFTGIGVSREEASSAAHTTCRSHIEASYCEKTECKENL